MSVNFYCRGWSITPYLVKYVAKRCTLGGFLVCGGCAEFDGDKRTFGLVQARSNFWFGSFRDHIKSHHHKKNCVTKACWEEEQELRVRNGDTPRKRNNNLFFPLLLYH